MHRILAQLLIVCLVLGSISPACKFVSGGKSFFEICFSDGSIQEVEMPSELLAFLPEQDQEEAPENPHPDLNDDCAFCFSQSHFSAFLVDAPDLYLPSPVRSALNFQTLVDARPELRLYQPRGPPAFLI